MAEDNGGAARNSCSTCLHFCAQVSRISGLKYIEGVGECRRNAPRGPFVFGWGHQGESELAHRAVVSPFPFVPDDDWCGEYSPSLAMLSARKKETGT
jgi:hypothetical protein